MPTEVLTGGINPFTSQFLTEERANAVGGSQFGGVPSAADNAPFSHAFSQRCWETVLRNIQYRRYQKIQASGSNAMDGVNNAVINSDLVPDGYWWYVHACALNIIKFTNQIIAAGIFMLSQNELADPPPVTGFPLVQSGIQLDDLTNASSLAASSSGIISLSRSFILPPRWALSAKTQVI